MRRLGTLMDYIFLKLCFHKYGQRYYYTVCKPISSKITDKTKQIIKSFHFYEDWGPY